MWRVIFHVVVVAINSSFMFYDQNYVKLPVPVKAMEDLPFHSRSMFLTIWGLVLQTVYHFVSLLNDIAGTEARAPKRPPIIRRIRDTFFSLAFTVAIYVSIAFWGIYAVNRDLIFPEQIAKVYPPLFNHVMHTTVTVFIFIELLTSYINYPSRAVGLSLMYIFTGLYIVWFFVVYAITGGWPYPVFDHLNWPLRIVFIAISLAIATGFYIFGEKLNKIVCISKQTFENGSAQLSAKSKDS